MWVGYEIGGWTFLKNGAFAVEWRRATVDISVRGLFYANFCSIGMSSLVTVLFTFHFSSHSTHFFY